MPARTAIQPDGQIENQAKCVYGKGEVLFRVGNGGAGATGLLEVLANDYLSSHQYNNKSIEWVCNHSRNTQLALNYGYVDIALTYERDQEALAASEGWSITAGCVFHDHFILAGPISDPAGLKSAVSLSDALAKIARCRALFHSRADGSATMWKERSLWSECGLKLWENEADKSWYKKSFFLGPAEALKAADEMGAYLLTDRSTLLRQVFLQTVKKTTVFFEPTRKDDALINSCYALRSASAPVTTSRFVDEFVEYLINKRGQDIIASYGIEDSGLPLLANISEGFAKTPLKGGIPSKGKWVVSDL